MDGPSNDHTKWSKSDRKRQMWYHLCVEFKKQIHMNLSMKQKHPHTHRKQTYDCQREKGEGRDKWGVWNELDTWSRWSRYILLYIT